MIEPTIPNLTIVPPTALASRAPNGLLRDLIDEAIGPVEPSERRFATVTPRSIRFAPDCPIEVWGAVTERVQTLYRWGGWALADCLNFGREHFSEAFAQFVQELPLAEKSLTNIARVGAAIPPDQRRDDVDFAMASETYALPPEVRDEMLDLAIEHGWKRAELRVQVRKRKDRLKRAGYAALPAPAVPLPGLTLHTADARDLPIASDTVGLIVTSPPYALNKEYGAGSADWSAETWQDTLFDALKEALRITRPGGRLALNVPLDTRGRRPTYAQAVEAALMAGWKYGTTIIWHDDDVTETAARGTEDSSAGPNIIARVEMIPLFVKGDEWLRPLPRDGSDAVPHQDWLDWTSGLWRFPGESRPWEAYPAAFPLELPRRLIALLSFTTDLVCDPFMGSGTTALAALRLGRSFVGSDLSEECVRSTQRRLAARLGTRS